QGITGTVKDSLGNPLAGVSVIRPDAPERAVTDEGGNFHISGAHEGRLQFSLLGYEKKELFVSSGKRVDIVLRLALSDLEEVVVVGFGTQKKINLTGAVSQVDGKALENRSVTNIGQA